ncbi:MAG: hypothetical protein AB1571_03605 [Nanoarchaeota archaeon]
MKRHKVNEYWLIIAVIILFIYFFIKLMDQSSMITEFPLDIHSDYTYHLARIHFMEKYGYDAAVPEWHNGMSNLLRYYPPGFFFFSLPLQMIFNNPGASMFVAVILIYLIALLFFVLFYNSLSLIKRIAFFIFFFGNPIAISYLLRLGKIPEMFGWLWFIPAFALIFYYKEHKIDKYFVVLLSIIGALIIISHPSVFIVMSLLLATLFLVKSNRERALIILSGAISLLLSSFWWYRLVFEASKVTLTTYSPMSWLLAEGPHLGDKVLSIVIPLIFFALFYFYHKEKKDVLFYSIPLAIGLLLITRIIVFIPYLNRPAPDTYNFFFIFLSLYLLFNTKFDVKFLKYINYLVVLLPILGIIFSIIITPWYTSSNKTSENMISLMPYIDDKFIILKHPDYNAPDYPNYLYSYAAIYYNLSTPAGMEIEQIPGWLKSKVNNLEDLIENKDCKTLKDNLIWLNTSYVISYEQYCKTLADCRFTEKKSVNNVCLFTL